MSYIPTPVKSVQQVSITCGGSPATATISAVVAAASLLIYQGHQSNDAGGSLNFDDFGYGRLTNSTTVTVTKQGNSALGGNIVWNGVVVEFLQTFIKSRGSGTIVIPDGSLSAAATITSVVTGKTLVAFTGCSNGNNANTGLLKQLLASLTLTNATTITAARPSTAAAGTSLTVGYNYLEFR